VKSGERWEQLGLDLGNLPAVAQRTTNRGSRGMLSTRLHLDQVRDEFLAANPGYSHIAGGRDANTGLPLKEEYLAGPGNSRTGSARPDLTFEASNGAKLRINTYDSLSNGLPDAREQANIDRIFELTGGETVIGIPKP
jgi:hypothetical protein